MKKILVAAMMIASICIGFSHSVSAAGQITGTITELLQRNSDGIIYLALTGTPTGRPACATSGYWMIANETSDTGKRLFATLLAAKLSNSVIQVIGTGTCTRWVDGEDINYVIFP